MFNAIKVAVTQKAFAQYYQIPLKTYEQWERGIRERTEYLLKLILYKIRIEHLAEGVTEVLLCNLLQQYPITRACEENSVNANLL